MHKISLFTAIILSLILPSALFAVVRISNMNDFAFGSWSGTGSLQSTDSVCAYDSAGGGTYRIRINGSGTASAYTLTNGTNTITYTAEFAGSSGVFTTMTSGTELTFSTPNTTSSTCGGGTNAQIRITIPEANLLAAPNGSYTGTISVRIRP